MRIADSPLVVDNFTLSTPCDFYFLTHFHSDHRVGLTSEFKKQIYCSEVTKELILLKFSIPAENLIALEFGVPHLIALTASTTISLKLLEANHCAGACMFLFEGYFGKILCTGDFRFESKLEIETVFSSPPDIDRLYLDTTFFDPVWAFPNRQTAIEQIIWIIEQHPKTSEVYIESDLLGQEPILVAISNTYSTKMHISKKSYYDQLICLGLEKYITLDEKLSRFHVCPHQSFSSIVSFDVGFYSEKTRRKSCEILKISDSSTTLEPKKLKKSISLSDFSFKTTETNTVYIKASAQWFATQNRNCKQYLKKPCFSQGVWHVLFSMHSSFEEIINFVTFLQPSKIYSIIPHTEKKVLLALEKYIQNPTTPSKIEIPLDIQELMNSSTPQKNSFTKKAFSRIQKSVKLKKSPKNPNRIIIEEAVKEKSVPEKNSESENHLKTQPNVLQPKKKKKNQEENVVEPPLKKQKLKKFSFSYPIPFGNTNE